MLKFIALALLWSFGLAAVADAQNLPSPSFRRGTVLDLSGLTPKSGDYSSFTVQNSNVDGGSMIAPQIPPGHYKGENIRSTMVVPNGTTTGTNSAYGFYVQNNSSADAVGMFGTCIQAKDNGTCWAHNPTLIDNPANGVVTNGVGRALVGSELDIQVTSPNTTVSGYNCTGSSGVQPAGADCFQVGHLLAADPTRGIRFTNGLSIGTGTSKVGILHGAYNVSGANTGGIPDQWLFRDANDAIRAVTTQISGQGGFNIGRVDQANGVTILPAATGQFPSVQAYGSDANVSLVLVGQGTGQVIAQSLFTANAGFYASGPITFAGIVTAGQPIKLPLYNVSALPTCNASLKGALAGVADGANVAYAGAVSGGGSTPSPVFCRGDVWVYR